MKALNAQTRITIKNILYATDLSPVAEDAARCTLELARRYGAKVFALHVHPIQVYGLAPPESWPVLREDAEQQSKEQQKHMDELFPDVDHDSIITEGDVWESIAAVMQQHPIDLIVVGTHGRKKIEKFLVGSVAENIFRRAQCPVLTIGPRNYHDPERAAHMKRILFATDLSPASEAAAAYAISLAQENQAHLDIVHVIQPQKAGEVVHSGELVGGVARKLRAMVPPDAELWCEPNMIVEVGEPAEQILNVAKARRSDMIVLGARHVDGAFNPLSHLPWATAYRIVSEAVCPVLTVHD